MEKKFWGYKAAVGISILAFINMGTSLLFSIFLADIATNSNSDAGSVMYFISIGTILSVGATAAMGKVLEKVSITVVCMIGTICTGTYLILLSMANSITMVYIAGAVAGIAWAWGLAAPVTIVIGEWFIKKRAQLLGISMGVMSLGGAAIISVATALSAAVGWSKCLLILGVASLVIGLFVEIVLIKTPEKMGQKPLGWEEAGGEEASEDGTIVKVGLTLKEAMKTPAFWVLMFASYVFTSAYEGIASYGPTFYAENGASATLISTMAILLQAGIFVGGIVAGWIGEHMGSKMQTIILCALLACGLFGLVIWSGNPSAILLAGAVAIGGLGNACFSVLPASLCGGLFGDKDYDAISPITVAAGYVGSVTSAIVMNFAMSLGNMGYYYLIFGVATVVSLVLLVLMINTAPVKKLMNK